MKRPASGVKDEAGRLIVDISDSAKGLSTSIHASASIAGFGILVIKERARQLGSLEIESVAGGGTCLAFRRIDLAHLPGDLVYAEVWLADSNSLSVSVAKDLRPPANRKKWCAYLNRYESRMELHLAAGCSAAALSKLCLRHKLIQRFVTRNE